MNASANAQDAGHHVVNEPKVGCHVVNEQTWNILSRTLGETFTYVYTRGLLAVEYLAKLSRIL